LCETPPSEIVQLKDEKTELLIFQTWESLIIISTQKSVPHYRLDIVSFNSLAVTGKDAGVHYWK
jgi:hypothetical protein